MRRYRELLAVPGVLRLTLAVLLSRAATSMFNLTLLVAATQAYGYAEAGLMMMAHAVSTAVVGPARGRLADRYSPRRVLLVLVAAHTVAYGGMLAGLALVAPVGVLYAAAVALGVSVPPTGPVTRGIWPHLVPEDRLSTAYAFDAALNNATFVSGPVLAGGLLFVLPAYGVVAVTAGVSFVGDLLVAVAPALRRHPGGDDARRNLLGPLMIGRVRLLLTMIALDTFAFGCLEVTAVAAASGQGSAGFFTSTMALFAVASGIAYGARTWPGSARAKLLVLHGGTAVGVAVCSTVGPGGAGVLAVLAAFAVTGLLTAPTETVHQMLVGELAPPGQRIEAFAWVFSTMWVGFGLGTTVAGQLAGPGETGPTLLAAALAQLAIVGLAAVGLRPDRAV